MTKIDGIDIPTSEDQPVRKGGLDLGSIVLLIGILAVIGVMGLQLIRQNESQPLAGSNAPNFTVTTFAGEEFTLSEQEGNIVIVNFWGSWCAPCRDEAPHLQAIHERYQDLGIIMFGVTHIDEEAASLAFMEEFGITYPNAPDPRSEISDRYNIKGVPETFVVGRDGEIVDGGAFLMPVSEAQLIEVIERELAAEGSAS